MRFDLLSKRRLRTLALMPAILLSLMVLAPAAALASPPGGGPDGGQGPAHHGG